MTDDVASTIEDWTAPPSLDADDLRFAAPLFQRLAAGAENLVVSPMSARMALAMVYGGARGDTERQMQDVLALGSQDTTHRSFGRMLASLAERGAPPDLPPDMPDHYRTMLAAQSVKLRISNRLWGSIHDAFAPAFLETLVAHYGAPIEGLDFKSAPTAACERINAAASEASEGRIQRVIGPRDIDPDTRLVVTNAIYLKAPWAKQFRASATRPGPFFAPGSSTTAALMTRTGSFGYAEVDGAELLDLPYLGGDLAMRVALPRAADGLAALERRVAPLVGARLSSTLVEVTLPRFRVELSLDLAKPLREMGMPLVFDPDRADLSGIDGTREIFVSVLRQKTFIDVNEEGTEAAAVTAVAAPASGVFPGKPAKPIVFRADRPFLFWIVDRGTGVVLFTGKLSRPPLHRA
jgi:serpin B